MLQMTPVIAKQRDRKQKFSVLKIRKFYTIFVFYEILKMFGRSSEMSEGFVTLVGYIYRLIYISYRLISIAISRQSDCSAFTKAWRWQDQVYIIFVLFI